MVISHALWLTVILDWHYHFQYSFFAIHQDWRVPLGVADQWDIEKGHNAWTGQLPYKVAIAENYLFSPVAD